MVDVKNSKSSKQIVKIRNRGAGRALPDGGMWVSPTDRRTLSAEATKPYSQGLTVLKRVTPMEYAYSEGAAASGVLGLAPRKDGRPHVGVVAQELQNVAPDMVGPGPWDVWRYCCPCNVIRRPVLHTLVS